MAILNLEIIDPKTRGGLRAWLQENHEQDESVWVTVYKMNADPNLLRTVDVVEECLCSGWVDSRPRKNNEQSYYLLISKRKPKSVWSAVNKKKVAQLTREKKITPFGLRVIAQAKANGSWDALVKSDELVLPAELKNAFASNKIAREKFEGFSKSSRRTLLEWIYASKSESTRLARIEKTVKLAALGLKANLIKE